MSTKRKEKLVHPCGHLAKSGDNQTIQAEVHKQHQEMVGGSAVRTHSRKPSAAHATFFLQDADTLFSSGRQKDHCVQTNNPERWHQPISTGALVMTVRIELAGLKKQKASRRINQTTTSASHQTKAPSNSKFKKIPPIQV